MSEPNFYSRRAYLRGAGACIALPFLPSLMGGPAVAAAKAAGIPKRLVFLPMGYGVNAENWFPSIRQPGRNYDLPPLVKPFEDLKGDISFIQNLRCARIPNPHAGTSNFLTCSASKAFKDRNFKNSVSCDQLAAELLGKETRFNYLAMGAVQRADGHGGLASYGHDGKPVGVHRDLTSLYRTLFGAGGKAEDIRARLKRQESSLDALLSEAKSLNRQINAADRDRVDEYFTSVRNIERRLSKAQEGAEKPYPKAPFKMPSAAKGRQQVQLVLDMMVTALQTDSTRVMSYMLPTGPIVRGLNAHRMSHQASGAFDPKNPTPHQARDLVMSQLVAGFLRTLKETKEVDGSSLLDHCLVAYGTCLRKGHQVSNGPLILAGHGGGGLKQGQNLVCKPGTTPLANLWLSMVRHVGVDRKRFANSNGVLDDLGFA